MQQRPGEAASAEGLPPPAHGAEVPTVEESTRTWLSEDWLATIVGLVLLGLILAGVITRGMVP